MRAKWFTNRRSEDGGRDLCRHPGVGKEHVLSRAVFRYARAHQPGRDQDAASRKAVSAACLGTGQRFVVDNTNPRAIDRAPYIAAAKQAAFRVAGYFFETTVRDALRRNKQARGRRGHPGSGCDRNVQTAGASGVGGGVSTSCTR